MTKWARLCRALVNSEMELYFLALEMVYLPSTTYDHNPLLERYKNSKPRYGIKPFRFKKIWHLHTDFITSIQDRWNLAGYSPNPLILLQMKIVNIKFFLKWWTFNIFRNIQQNLKDIGDKLISQESKLQTSGSLKDSVELHILRAMQK